MKDEGQGIQERGRKSRWREKGGRSRVGVVGGIRHQFVETFGGKTELHRGVDEIVGRGDGDETLVEVFEKVENLLKVGPEEFLLEDLQDGEGDPEEGFYSLAHEPIPNPQHVWIRQR